MKKRNQKNDYRSSSNRKHQALSTLSLAVMACMSQSSQASDLEIYQAPEEGKVVLTMMLDNSGSMDATDNSSCTNANRTEEIEQKIYDNNGADTGEIKKYSVNYCRTRIWIPFYGWYETGRYYDRISRVKMALIPMFANPKSEQGFGEDTDLNKYKIGLGSFVGGGNTQSAGRGKIDVTAEFLDKDQRIKLIDQIASYNASTNTPLANAYAAAGAYMLGTSTDALPSQSATNIYNLVAISYKKNNGQNNQGNYKSFLNKCNSDYDTQSTDIIGGYSYYRCVSYSQESRNNQGPDINASEYITVSGTSSDVDSDWRTSTNGNSEMENITFYFQRRQPVQTSTSPIIPGQCNAQGIYFLTDGQPNQSQESDTLNLMNNSLGRTPAAMGTSCNSTLSNSGAGYGSYAGWGCMGEYAPLLNSSTNYQNAAVETATVGFGSVYKELSTIPKIEKTITKPNGETEVVSVYNCDSEDISSRDAKNLCRLGEKGYGFGQGGFYYTETSRDVSDSVKSFVKSMGDNVIDPISSGTMAVPLDSLSGLRSRGFAYLPILEPVPGSPLLWKGNLKKYKTKDATLVGADNNFVFQDQKGTFATNTHDLWNTIIDNTRLDAKRPDAAKPQVGGAYQKIFENGNGASVGSRNVFVENSSTLTNLTVDADGKPNNFGSGSTTSLSGYTNAQKVTLLNFMGYSVPDSTIVQDGQALGVDKNKWSKNLGGVLHSIPQLITQKVNIKPSGEFDRASRKDYILYGSMDGALHMVDDSTGQETFTFIPKQILDLQPAAIKGEGTAIDGSYPYGVDAPWLTYASYTVKENTTGTGDNVTTTNTYEASQSFALGGLRMGGSTYYALDVTSPTTPKLIYSIGSNYANRQKGLTTEVRGIKNGASSVISASTATADQKAYARMGQTWGKPELGYVKSGGKRVMVSFLPGGYDTCYEDPKFKLTGTNATDTGCNKATAQGNAMYMVQVGEIKKNSNKEEQVETGSDSGKLLWWASSDATGSNNTSRSSSLQQSKVNGIKHSIVTQVRTLDRNYDGLTDHIYFADLGGQVWRADINNNADTDNFKIDRVVKVLNVSDQASGDDAPPRIYERPLVTFHNGIHSYIDEDNNSGQYSGIEALVTVGTGDRSSPVTATRNTPNAIYSIIDKDVARADLFYYDAGTAPTISLRTPTIKVAGNSSRNDKLQELTFTEADIGNTGIKTRMQTNAIQGWYMPLTHWLDEDAVNNGKYKLKMFNEPDALAGILITSSFNPDEGQDPNSCSAGVIGETQRERTCLPYGVCQNTGSGSQSGGSGGQSGGSGGQSGGSGGQSGGSGGQNGGSGGQNEVVTTRSSYNAGLGIVDNIISQYNDSTLFTALKNRCEGDECIPKEICAGPDCDDDDDDLDSPLVCVGGDCGADDAINVDKRINPLSWMER